MKISIANEFLGVNRIGMVQIIEHGLRIRTAAIKAKKITDAGFEFDQIQIDGIHLHRTPEGICEHAFYDESLMPF